MKRMSMAEFKLINLRRAKVLGSHGGFFDSPLRKSLQTVIANKYLIYNKYFITSEFMSTDKRMLTVRTANVTSGLVGIAGCQMMHSNLKEAINYIRKIEFKN